MIARILNRSRDALYLPGAEGLWANRLRGRVTVLVYHRVAAAPGEEFLDRGGVPRITPDELRTELAFLLSLGAQFLTFRDLRAGRFPREREMGVVVSFDDGFRDSYEQGLPVLESLGGRGVVFQCTAMLTGAGLLPEHRLYRLLHTGKRQERQERAAELGRALGVGMNSESDVDALKQAALMQLPFDRLGAVLDAVGTGLGDDVVQLYPDAHVLKAADAAGHEIGSHGHSHLHRATLTDEQFIRELETSRELLRDTLGTPPAVFSYPFGALAATDRDYCAKYYQQAVTCVRSRVTPDSDPLAMGRFSWPGPPAPQGLRQRRWLLSGSV